MIMYRSKSRYSRPSHIAPGIKHQKSGSLRKTAQRFETQEKGEEGGGTSYTKPSPQPYFNFSKCHLLCSLAQANRCEILTVSIESVIDSWVCVSRHLFKQRLKRSIKGNSLSRKQLSLWLSFSAWPAYFAQYCQNL